MILAYHVIFGTYGFWLPNDPRGSWSDFVRSWELLRYGQATHVHTRRSTAYGPHDLTLRQQAKSALKYPPVVFDGHQALAVARGFADQIQTSGYKVFECSILPEHVHMVVGRHHYKIEQVVNLMKGNASQFLEKEGRHPLAAQRQFDGTLPSAWERKCWKVYLSSHAEIRVAIEYVRQNPMKEGKKPQHWWFLTKFV